MLRQRYTPSCPEDPDENDETRRTISRIQQEVERELEHADRILNGSRANSRAESMQIRSDSVRKDVNADSGATDGCRSSVTPIAGSNDRGARNEGCSRMSQAATFLPNRETGYDFHDRAYQESDGPHGQYSFHESTGASGSPGPVRPRDPYDGSGRAGSPYGGSVRPGDPHDGSDRAGSPYGGSVRPGDPYDGSGRAGSPYGGSGRPSDPHDGSGRAGSPYGGPGRPGDPYDGSDRVGSPYRGSVRPGDPHDGSGRAGSPYEGPGRPGDPHDGSGRAGSPYGGPGRPGDPYDGSDRAGSPYRGSVRPGDPHDGSGRAGSPYGGPGRPGDPYDGSGRAGSPYGGPGRPGDPHDGSGRAGSPYEGPGRPGDPYDSFGRAGSPYGKSGRPSDPNGGTSPDGVSHGLLEAYPQGGHFYAERKGTGSSAIRIRDPSKMDYDPGRNASGISFNAASPASYDSRGKSPPLVHYSPSTASHVGSPSRMESSKPVSETNSNFAGGRSPTETQYSASRAESRADFTIANSPAYERGKSPTGTVSPSSKYTSDLMGAVFDAVGFEKSGDHPSLISGSGVSPVRSTRGGSPIDGNREIFGTGRNDQSTTDNNKICPAAMHGKCPAFARDSNITEQTRSTLASFSSASKRPLSRIEEGPSREEMAGNEVQGQHSCFQGEDFRHPAGGSCSKLQAGKEVYTPCPPRIPPRPRCESSGQPMYDSMINDQFQSTVPRPQQIRFGQPPMQSRVFASSPEHHHHDHHDHDMESFHGKSVHLRDEKAISALNHLSQLKKSPSYYRCKFDRELDLSSCEKTTKDAPKMMKLPEKPCKGIEELQEMISCETQDVDSAWYLTSDEKKTYKKPCPKQQKAQENVKSIVKAQTPQTCPKEYTPLDHPDPDDITPELAASMMFSQEKGIKLNECPDETIKRFFPDIQRPPFPVKLSAVHIVDSNQEDQEQMIEKSASVPSEGVSDSAYTRTMQNKGDIGAQKSYDIDFAVGAEKREYVLVAEKPQRYNKVQFRGNLPSWFPGYMQAFPADKNGMQLAASPSELFQKAWTNANPENIPSSDVVVLE